MATVTPHRVRAGRGIELALLLLALVIGVGAYALVGLNTRGKVPADILGYGLGIAVLGLGLHVVLRLRAPYADPVILPTVVALNGIGLAMIYRLDIAEAARGHSESLPPVSLPGRHSVASSLPPCCSRCATTGRCAATPIRRCSSVSAWSCYRSCRASGPS